MGYYEFMERVFSPHMYPKEWYEREKIAAMQQKVEHYYGQRSPEEIDLDSWWTSLPFGQKLFLRNVYDDAKERAGADQEPPVATPAAE